MHTAIRLGRGIGREIDPKERELEQLLKNIDRQWDRTIETAHKYWPSLFPRE